jgi:hypothetical protein
MLISWFQRLLFQIQLVRAYNGGSLTFAFAVPIWARVMGQPAPDDGPGRDAAAAGFASITDDESASSSGGGEGRGGGAGGVAADVPGILQTLRATVLAQYRRLMREFRAKASREGRDARARGGGGGVEQEEEGAEANNLFFEWQQARDVTMLTALGPCVDQVKRTAIAGAEETRERLRQCEGDAMRGHWVELYGSDEYKRVSAFIRNSLRSYMSALGLEGDAASRRGAAQVAISVDP